MNNLSSGILQPWNQSQLIQQLHPQPSVSSSQYPRRLSQAELILCEVSIRDIMMDPGAVPFYAQLPPLLQNEQQHIGIKRIFSSGKYLLPPPKRAKIERNAPLELHYLQLQKSYGQFVFAEVNVDQKGAFRIGFGLDRSPRLVHQTFLLILKTSEPIITITISHQEEVDSKPCGFPFELRLPEGDHKQEEKTVPIKVKEGEPEAKLITERHEIHRKSTDNPKEVQIYFIKRFNSDSKTWSQLQQDFGNKVAFDVVIQAGEQTANVTLKLANKNSFGRYQSCHPLRAKKDELGRKLKCDPLCGLVQLNKYLSFPYYY